MSWQTESGLFTDYEGVVIDAFFMQGQSGNQEMHWKLNTDSPDVPETEERWGCGKDWTSPDGGRTVVKSRGKQEFKRNSSYGRVIGKVVEILGGEEEAKKILGGSPTDASVWTGSKWYFEEFDAGFTNRQTGEKVEYLINLPVKFLGKEQVAGGGSSSGTVTTSQTSSVAPASSNNPLDALPEKDRIMLKMYAGQTEFDGWVDKLLESVGNNDLLNTDQGNMILGTADAIYQQLRGQGASA